MIKCTVSNEQILLFHFRKIFKLNEFKDQALIFGRIEYDVKEIFAKAEFFASIFFSLIIFCLVLACLYKKFTRLHFCENFANLTKLH